VTLEYVQNTSRMYGGIAVLACGHSKVKRECARN